jgi:TM2 domain-containing membrane protein YozV
MRSVGLAYGLWALCLVGVAGIHRFYAGKYITGTSWLFTWGLLGVGLFIDLFLIPGLIERKNRALAAVGSWQYP